MRKTSIFDPDNMVFRFKYWKLLIKEKAFKSGLNSKEIAAKKGLERYFELCKKIES